MSTMILLRHGQATFGADRYDQLSPLGEAQARATGAFFASRGLSFSKALSGPRARHRHTAELVCGGFPISMTQALDEFAEGEQIIGAAERRIGARLQHAAATRHAQLKAYNEQINLWAQGCAHIDNVPPASEFRGHIAAWLASVTASNDSGQCILAVTSAGVVAAVLCEVIGLPDKAMATYMEVLGNSSITSVQFSRGRLTLREFNVTQHLPATLISSI
jgi:broad specificity phosphatase PhoE